MIYSYSNEKQIVETDASVKFDIDEIKTGCTVTHKEGGETFTLNRPGFYYVSATAVGQSSNAMRGDKGIVPDPFLTLQFYDGEKPIEGTVSSASTMTSSDVVNLTIVAIIQVKPSCCMIDSRVQLSLKNLGLKAIYTNATMTITKIA